MRRANIDPKLIKAESHQKGRELPPSLVAGLTPATRHALNHPVRRRILRTLNETQAGRTADSIATVIQPNPGVNIVGYHLRVLQQLGCARTAEPPSNAGEHALPLYESSVAGDEGIRTILQATRQLDRSHD